MAGTVRSRAGELITVVSGEVLLVRHGAVNHGALATYAPIYDGGRYDFVPLSEDGVRQIEQLVPVLRPRRPGLVVSSPYTRTLQTAAILAVGLGCRLTVDLGLHDWLPMKDGQQLLSAEVVATKIAEYDRWTSTGILPPDRTWESNDEMRSRLLAGVGRHDTNDGLVIVTHEAVIKSAVPAVDVPLASWHVLAV